MTYSVGTTLRTLLMHDKKKEKKGAGGTRKYRKTSNTERKRKERKWLKGNNSLNSQIKMIVN